MPMPFTGAVTTGIATVCQRIRETSDVPIVVVSGERDRAATVELLDLGADDYIRKPFRADELNGA